jgi:hypothetical protein
MGSFSGKTLLFSRKTLRENRLPGRRSCKSAIFGFLALESSTR